MGPPVDGHDAVAQVKDLFEHVEKFVSLHVLSVYALYTYVKIFVLIFLVVQGQAGDAGVMPDSSQGVAIAKPDDPASILSGSRNTGFRIKSGMTVCCMSGIHESTGAS
jgi:hypothetical protein